MNESVAMFGKTNSLVGIVTKPDNLINKKIAVIILNAGFLHRVGPNRIYVKLARKIAQIGFLVMRFDFSGIGDSYRSETNEHYIERQLEEINEAMDYLSSKCNIHKFIIAGLCSGGDMAFEAATKNHRVAGLIGINGNYIDQMTIKNLNSVISGRTQARYYKKKILDVQSWLRLIHGKSDFKKIFRIIRDKFNRILSSNNKQDLPKDDLLNAINEISKRQIKVLLIYSEGSEGYDIFTLLLDRIIRLNLSSSLIDIQIIKNSDHTFSLLEKQNKLIDSTKLWLEKNF